MIPPPTMTTSWRSSTLLLLRPPAEIDPGNLARAGRSGEGQRELDHRAAPGVVAGLDGPPVRRHEFARDCETQARTLGPGTLDEPLEDAWQQLCREALARVVDGDPDHGPVHHRPNRDHAARRRVPDGIGQEVCEHASDSNRVRLDGGQ